MVKKLDSTASSRLNTHPLSHSAQALSRSGTVLISTGSNDCHIKNGRIAQLVEQRIENPRVPGSIPGSATI